MPKVVSSSSSEDEADGSTPETVATQKESGKKSTRFQCPADFVTFCHEPCSNTLSDRLKDPNNQLWLIKAPLNFDPQCFSAVRVPLSGLQTLSVPADGADTESSYSVLASDRSVTELRLLTADHRSSDSMVLAPAFSGLLNVCENHGDVVANRAPNVIPAPPPLAIPTGLKQRFHPFGSKTPALACVAESEVDGAAYGPSSATLCPLVVKRFNKDGGVVEDEDEDEHRKKKKKKKEKRLKTEGMVVEIKQEPEAEQEQERRKKKKKKKDRYREEVEEGLEPSIRVKEEPLIVKSEPKDSDDADTSVKKKKKRKRKSENE